MNFEPTKTPISFGMENCQSLNDYDCYNASEKIAFNSIDKINDNSYNSSDKKEDVTMSSLCVLFLGQEVYIASDSNSTLINGETEYEYKKLFSFKNGVFGIVGNNSINTNDGLRNIGDVFIDLINNDTVTEKDFDEAVNFFIKEYKLTQSTSEIILILQDNNKIIYKYYAFNNSEYIVKNYIDINPNTFHTYAINRATFEKGNSNFITIANKAPKETLTKFIRFNEAVELFINNTRLVGGPIQMYKINVKGNIENLSEPPFNK